MRLIGNILLGAVVAFVAFWVIAVPVYLVSGNSFSGAGVGIVMLATVVVWILAVVEFQAGSPHISQWMNRGGFIAPAQPMIDAAPKPGAVDRIRQAKALLDEGAISESEYETIKQRALREV